MPDVKVYIRKSNLDKWLAIDKPSEWINALLANSGDTSEYGKTREINNEPYVTVLSEELPEVVDVRETKAFKQFLIDYKYTGVPKPPHPDWGYPCCWDNKKRCQHWDFDAISGNYINKLTSEVIEAL